MIVRKAIIHDLPALDSLYKHARAFMKENGNPNQWKDNRPDPKAVEADLASGSMYVLEDNGKILGAFSILTKEDPTYQIIDQGSWENEDPYCVIHRIASNQKGLHLFETALQLAAAKSGELRIDTHEDNKIMRSLFAKHHITYRGIIYTDDGTPRLAYSRTFSKEEREKARSNPLLTDVIF